MSVTSNYTGRLVDLFIFQGAKPLDEQKITLSFGTGGAVTTGVQKMSQVFANHFLTEKGSVPLLPDKGTLFLTAIRQGRILDESSLQSEFVIATEAVKRAMSLQAEQNGLPEDEQIANIELVSFSIDKIKSTLVVYIKLTSVAGSAHDLFLPLSTALR